MEFTTRGAKGPFTTDRNQSKSSKKALTLLEWCIPGGLVGFIFFPRADYPGLLLILSSFPFPFLFLSFFTHSFFLLTYTHTLFLPHTTLSPLFYSLLLPLALSFGSLPCLLSSIVIWNLCHISPLFSSFCYIGLTIAPTSGPSFNLFSWTIWWTTYRMI